MKKILSFVVLLILCVVVVAFGADAVAVTPAATSNTLQSIIDWMVKNQIIVGMMIVGILDFVFAINPQWKSNGVFHFIYTLAQSKTGQNTQNNTRG